MEFDLRFTDKEITAWSGMGLMNGCSNKHATNTQAEAASRLGLKVLQKAKGFSDYPIRSRPMAYAPFGVASIA